MGITLFFLMEIVIRMLAERSLLAFFRKGWNVFDFLIVTASLIPVEESEMALLGRLLRIFRVLRLVSIIPELRVLLNAFLNAIPRMGYVSLMMFIIFYIYAAMGSIFFGQINPSSLGQYLHCPADLVPRGDLRGLDRRHVRDHGGLSPVLDLLSQLHFHGGLHFSEHDDRHRAGDTAA